MISCPKCGKENQDHYKFCLGCGAELPRDAAPKAFSPQTPNQGVKAAKLSNNTSSPGIAAATSSGPGGPSGMGPTSAPTAPHPAVATAVPPQVVMQPPAAAPAPAAVAAAAPGTVAVICPQCSHVNTDKNIFCGSCGYRLLGAAGRAPSAPAVELAPSAGGGGVVLTALRADGSEAGNYNLPGGTVTVGRDTGSIFAGDSYLSPRHATFRQPGPGKLHVKDEASLNGVYKKLTRDVPVELRPNDVFRIGQEIVRFEPLTPQPPSPDGVERLGAPSKGYVGRIALVIGRDTSGNAFPVPETGVHLGRERGDVLFPEDGYVSGLHCHLAWVDGRLMLTDLGSSNGTFLRLREEAELHTGDVLLMGQQLFRISM